MANISSIKIAQNSVSSSNEVNQNCDDYEFRRSHDNNLSQNEYDSTSNPTDTDDDDFST